MTLSPRLLWLPALLLGLGITLALFWLMALMVAGGDLRLPQSSPRRLVEFVRLKPRPNVPPPTRHQLPNPPPKEPPPRPVLAVPRPVASTATPQIDLPALDLPLSIGTEGSLLGGLDIAPVSGGQLVPLVRILPRYPIRARMRHIEGWVKLEFTITAEGTVKDIRVVEAHPPGVFERAAIEAISRWKFKPLEIDGHGLERRATQKLEFKLPR